MRRALPVVLAASLLAGCGTGDDREQARAVTERFLAALRHHDGAAACEQLSEAAAKALEQQEGKPYHEAVPGVRVQGGGIVAVRVYITSAKVDFTTHQSAFLDRGPSGWKLSAVGCGHGGRPADHPFTCELED